MKREIISVDNVTATTGINVFLTNAEVRLLQATCDKISSSYHSKDNKDMRSTDVLDKLADPLTNLLVFFDKILPKDHDADAALRSLFYNEDDTTVSGPKVIGRIDLSEMH